jgi:hypothetical protein
MARIRTKQEAASILLIMYLMEQRELQLVMAPVEGEAS